MKLKNTFNYFLMSILSRPYFLYIWKTYKIVHTSSSRNKVFSFYIQYNIGFNHKKKIEKSFSSDFFFFIVTVIRNKRFYGNITHIIWKESAKLQKMMIEECILKSEHDQIFYSLLFNFFIKLYTCFFSSKFVFPGCLFV